MAQATITINESSTDKGITYAVASYAHFENLVAKTLIRWGIADWQKRQDAIECLHGTGQVQHHIPDQGPDGYKRITLYRAGESLL